MPELHFKGKEYVFNHHLTVPYRPLVSHPDKSIGKDSGNLIIQGDNLHALKALLPSYAGKVDCIFIDPPYNTGNENWCYNDNVNSPMMREWIDSNPINKEDMLRHDKWACMMYPRFKLLHELLSEDGSFWMTLDDNEYHRARVILDEIFGEDNFVACAVWEKTYTPKSNGRVISTDHDYVILYSKSSSFVEHGWNYLDRNEEQQSRFTNSDNDPKGPWRTYPLDVRTEDDKKREKYRYSVTLPSGRIVRPAKGRHWSLPEEEFKKQRQAGNIYFGKGGDAIPTTKVYLESVDDKGVIARTWWPYKEVKGNQDAKKNLIAIMSDETGFITPKPYQLIQRVLNIATDKESLILDSFAGSATTAHAVLAQNAKDGGNRRFILVECEDYADNLTAERVRRVAKGYKFTGTLREELLRENITWSKFSKESQHEKLLAQVQAIEDQDASRFDEIKKTIKDGELIVTGEKKVTKKTEGLGGGFNYYTLGEPLDLDKMLTGKSLPDYANIGAWLFHTATGDPLNTKTIKENQWYLGSSEAFHVWLIYKPELDFLKSRDAALTLSLAEKFAKKKGKRHLVFAPSRFVPNKMLLPLGVEYAPLPFALYRFEKD